LRKFFVCRISLFSASKFNIPDAIVICESVAHPLKYFDLKETNPDEMQPENKRTIYVQ